MSFSLSFTGNTRSSNQLVQFVSFFPFQFHKSFLSILTTHLALGLATLQLGLHQNLCLTHFASIVGNQTCQNLFHASKEFNLHVWSHEQKNGLARGIRFCCSGHILFLDIIGIIWMFFFCCCCKSKCEMSALTWVEHGWTGSWLTSFTGSQINKFNISI